MTKRALLVITFLWAGTHAPRAQQVTQDWKLHNAGQVIQIIQNQGNLNQTHSDYPGLINTEFPPNSFQEHMGSVGPFFGGIVQKPNGPDTLVSSAERLGGGAAGHVFEGFTDQLSDTVWVAQPGDMLDIPYTVPYPDGTQYVPDRDSADGGYTPISSQDFVTRYNDYNDASLQIQNHEPMYLDVIQTSYAFGSPPLDDVVIVNYALVPTQYDIDQLHVGLFVDGNVGNRTGSGFTFAQDDYAKYYGRENDEFDFHMGATFDAPGSQSDGGEYTPVGTMMIPSQEMQEELPAADSAWTWVQRNRFEEVLPPPGQDGAVYQAMASKQISPDQVLSLYEQTTYYQTVGPVDVAAGDTAHISVAMVLGEDEADLLNNADVVQFAAERDFQLPSSPPVPDVEVSARSKEVTLDWSESAGAVEDFVDPNRVTKQEDAFEGYRLWKSTQSDQGPWTLLAQYDVDDNAYGPNTGIPAGREYTDEGLVNNVEYYYAVTAYSKPDTISSSVIWPSQSTSRAATAETIIPGSGPQEDVEGVAVVPNPYRGDVRYQDFNPPWEKPPDTRERWLEQDRRLQFINLPPRAVIKIYTLDGTLVQTLRHDSNQQGFEDWDMVSRAGQAIASGIYLFTVEDLDTGNAQTGKFVVIK